MAFEVLVGLVALAATVSVYLSLPHLGSGTEAKARVRPLDPAVLKAATKGNPCTAGSVALTFDDGPDLYTEPILDVLRAYGAKATFFVLGSKVGESPEAVRKAVRDGHRVENHSWDHPHLTDLTTAEIDAQVIRTQRALVEAGVPAPTRLRAPFNNQDHAVRAAVARQGLRLDRWDVDSGDWRGRGVEDIVHAVVDGAHPGAVILLHDGIQDSATTLQALPGVIEGIRSRGFCTSSLS